MKNLMIKLKPIIANIDPRQIQLGYINAGDNVIGKVVYLTIGFHCSCYMLAIPKDIYQRNYRGVVIDVANVIAPLLAMGVISHVTQKMNELDMHMWSN